jgi:hypothetical protein
MKDPNIEKIAKYYAAIIAEIGGDPESEGCAKLRCAQRRR